MKNPHDLFKDAFKHLNAGEYKEGFTLYENRWHPLTRQLLNENWQKWSPAPVWEGQDLHGKSIVVQMEQGFGDVFQFYRFLPMLKVWGAKQLIVLQEKSLVKFLVQYPCVDLSTNDSQIPEVQNADYWIGSMSLAHFAINAPAQVKYLFPVTREKIVGSEGYLDVIPSNIEPKVGINWAASRGPLHYIKSVSVEAMRELCGLDCYSLNPATDDLFVPIPDDEWRKDWYMTARHIKAMKGIVAVDTATAHLAGALGVKCILLLPEKDYVDWRWKNGAWYDSVCPLPRKDWKEIPDLIRKM